MKQKHIYNLAALLLASSAAFISCSDTDLDGPQTDGDRGASVVFNIKDIQQDNIAKVNAATRAGIAPTLLYTPGLTQEDLAPRRLEAVSSDGLDACLIETTVEGINPTKPDPSTRAKVETSIEHDFTTLGYRGETAGTISDKPEWFYSKKTKKNGELYETHFWSWGKPYGRFYAIYPEATAANKITLSPDSHQGTPYLDFEVEEDVADQKDLMTACSGVVHYDTQNTAPTTNLEFRHALTAIKFAVGNNLSWGKQISNIEIRNAVYKGRYNLSDKLDGNGAGWVASSLTARKDFSLTVSPTIDTKKNPGAIITGTATDNYTFYMIPQELTGKNVEAAITFTDASSIQVTLTGTWKAGTTKTYKISNTISNWDYELSVSSPASMDYNATTSDNYVITSYRRAPDGTIHPVKWEVVGYDADGDNVFKMEEKPTWLTSLSKINGDGGTTAETGTATVSTSALIDKLTERNDKLKEDAKGSSGDYYDLSTHDIKGNTTSMNTANCYVISHPGYYKIPLVYGNAIKNGATNENAYKTSNSGTYILSVFKDHDNKDITNPWIGLTNGGANVPKKVKLIWADEQGLITTPKVVGSGNSAYLQFRVPTSSIKNGNAVLAVTDDSGTVLWSWHLWFAPDDVLNTTECTNFQNKTYKFSKETIGWKYTEWKMTSYEQPRSVRIKVHQLQGNSPKKESVITIVQKPGVLRKGYATYYQFGRKDAFPGLEQDALPQGNFVKQYNNTWPNIGIGSGIQNPDKVLLHYFLNNTQANLWSMQNVHISYPASFNDEQVIKTIYDPSPAGFHVPESNAFTGFSTNGENTGRANARGDFNFGWDLYNKLENPTATIYIPAIGFRYFSYGGDLLDVGKRADYWTAVPFGNSLGARLFFYLTLQFYPKHNGTADFRNGHGIRSVADE